MENIEVILLDIKKDRLDKFVADRLITESSEIKSSHFFDTNLEKDLELHELDSIRSVLSPRGTGNIVFNKLNLGMNLHNVVTVFSFDEICGDVEFNFTEDQFIFSDASCLREQVETLLEYLSILKKEFKIPVIRVGFEPASDDSMLICELNNKTVDLDDVISKLMNG
jgi:hypothetical protein